MLIRSQDKKAIIKLSKIIIYQKDDEDWQILSIDTPDSEAACPILGHYSSEEKAIKVLDMIELEYRKYLHVAGGPALMKGGMDVQPAAYNIPKVFQMPQDDEVII